MQTRKMTPTLLTAIAALVTLNGCSSQNQTARCVDQNGRILPNSYCQQYSSGYYGGGGTYIYPRRVYGGAIRGGRVSGYSSSPSSEGGVFRGGFGFHGGGGA